MAICGSAELRNTDLDAKFAATLHLQNGLNHPRNLCISSCTPGLLFQMEIILNSKFQPEPFVCL